MISFGSGAQRFWNRARGKASPRVEPRVRGASEPNALLVSADTLRGHAIDSSLLFVTLTNAGYLAYTRNFLASLQRVGLRDKLVVFCIDDESLAAMRAEGVHAYRVDYNDAGSEIQDYHEGRFREITLTKLCVVHELLALGFDVLYADGDIVFLRDPIKRMRRALASADLVVQNDDPYKSRNKDPMQVELCMGFFVARPTQRTLSVFDPARIGAEFSCDQSYVNAMKSEIGVIHILDRDRFANGSWFLDRPGSDHARRARRALMIHFNWRIGTEKFQEMQKHSLWLVDDVPDASPTAD